MISKISLRTGILSLLAVTTFLLLIVSLVGIIAINKGNQSLEIINRIQGTELNGLYQSNELLLRTRYGAVAAMRKIEIGKIAEGRLEAKRVADYVAQSRLFLQRFLEAGTVTDHGQNLADAIAKTYQRYFDDGITPLLAALNRENSAAYYAVMDGNIGLLSMDFLKAVNNFDVYAEKVSQQKLAEATHNEHIMQILIGICCGTSLVLVVLAWFAMSTMLLMPLNRAINHLEQIASGDLTQPILSTGRNELGRLNIAMREMQQSLANSVSRVRDASLQIDVSSRELAAGNLNLSQRTEASAASLEETAASMEQLTATVHSNADNAHQGYQLADQVADTAVRGADGVHAVVRKMQDISDCALRIATILGVIDEIAFQTNILALNASVEAARAGEQGRGFAVVASEVRHLAQRSGDAAKEVRILIDESQIRVGEGNDMAEHAGKTMDKISVQVMRMTSLMKEISEASHEQRNGISQVNQAVVQMDEAAQQDAALVEQSSAATQSLEEQSRHLVQAMAVFTLSAA